MRKIFCAVVLSSIFLISLPAGAEVASPCADRNFECMVVTGFGANTGNLSRGTFFGAFRISYLRRIPIALEVNTVLPFGVGANLLLYLFRGNHFSIHVIDVGLFYSWIGEVAAPWVVRKFDVTAGAGIEVRLRNNLSITLDWRAFFADPFSVIPNYGDYGLKAFREAMKGGELWLGLGYRF